ncbi:MAG: branched-chain amino acid ABC transporter substrate-binding protein [Desulfobacterales bacterium]|jgi:branched-chain amino acid transport system substrate-binding protein|nr:branched-chain amino acid ABC transporter substrate-binding protein [Desulfobacteraceae bacterium]MBT4363583.1 branched-chain amino acid ABC transporter substrate-binding protein [Desulfobacteraceae bacterium]MBT7085828.1 branched-chain amino acid ABC transporter substrate-binding protein [Desulfobacterales bacterium]
MKNTIGKLFCILTTGLLLMYSIHGCSFAPDTINLGVAGAHSGDLASYGLPTVKAAEIVIKEINAKGGVLGKKVRLLVEDDVCKPEIATNTATKLISKGAHVVIGHICSGATKAALGIYKESSIICMSPSATNTDLTLSGDYPNFYRTIAYDDAQAQLQVNYATKILKVKKVAVLHDKGDYGKGQAELSKKYFEKSGVKVVLFQGVTPGALDYTAIVTKVKREKVDLVVWGGYHPEASKIISKMRKNRMKTGFMGADGLKDKTFIKVAGKNAEGAYVTGPRDVSKNPLAIASKEAHRKAYSSDPGAFFDSAYAAAQALLNAIEKAGSTDYSAVSKALKTEYIETPLGKISFDKNGDATGIGFSVYQVKNGVFVEVN